MLIYYVTLSLLSVHTHLDLSCFYLRLFSFFIDHELCDRESDMPWGIQMCIVSLIMMSSLTRVCRLHLLISFTQRAISFLLPFSAQDDTTTFKQVHRTQPILSYNPSILDHPTMTLMSEKKDRKRSMAFGLPREKVREFMKSHNLMHWKVPRSTPTLYP